MYCQVGAVMRRTVAQIWAQMCWVLLHVTAAVLELLCTVNVLLLGTCAQPHHGTGQRRAAPAAPCGCCHRNLRSNDGFTAEVQPNDSTLGMSP